MLSPGKFQTSLFCLTKAILLVLRRTTKGVYGSQHGEMLLRHARRRRGRGLGLKASKSHLIRVDGYKQRIRTIRDIKEHAGHAGTEVCRRTRAVRPHRVGAG